MFLKFETRLSIKKCKHGKRAKPLSQLTRTRTVCICKCDTCLNEFEILRHPKKTSERNLHFCSIECRVEATRSGNVLCNRIEETSLEKFGVKRAFIQPDVLKTSLEKSHSFDAQKLRSKSLRRYHLNRPANWKNPGNSKDACKKRHETMKRNGTYGKSKSEDLLFDALCQVWGETNVIRQIQVNGWAIDFWIKTCDIYVQVDGIYWHGLNKTIEELRSVQTSRGRSILATRLRDEAQNQWFEKEQKVLVRVTDLRIREIFANE